MRTPGWLADVFQALNRQRMKGDITRDEAVLSAIQSAVDKDPDFLAEIHQEWFGQRLDTAFARLKKEAAGNGRALAATGERQGGFDEICSDFFPRDTYGPMTPLEELWIYHEQQCTMTANFAHRDEEREMRLRELDAAVKGDRKASWEAAERARLGLASDDAAINGG